MIPKLLCLAITLMSRQLVQSTDQIYCVYEIINIRTYMLCDAILTIAVMITMDCAYDKMVNRKYWGPAGSYKNVAPDGSDIASKKKQIIWKVLTKNPLFCHLYFI